MEEFMVFFIATCETLIYIAIFLMVCCALLIIAYFVIVILTMERKMKGEKTDANTEKRKNRD